MKENYEMLKKDLEEAIASKNFQKIEQIKAILNAMPTEENNLQEGVTGYPHIDRPWMKWYQKGNLDDTTYDTNVTRFLREVNAGREEKLANTFYGKEKSNRELSDDTDKASTILSELGVKKNEIILFLAPNIPEEEEICLGAIQIGAISDFVDPRPDSIDIMVNAKKILGLIKQEKPKYIVAIDQCYLGMLKPIENEIKELGINDIILLSSKDSMDKNAQYEYFKDLVNYDRLRNKQEIIEEFEDVEKLKTYGVIASKLKEQEQMDQMIKEAIKTSPLRVMNYNTLKKECSTKKFESVTDPNQTVYVGHTSGTSGKGPKPIPITNAQIISSMIDNKLAGVGPKEDQSSLHLIPGFAAFGRVNNDFQTYTNKAYNIHVPEFLFSEFGYLLKRYKPNAIMVPPALLLTLPDCKYLEKEDMSFLTKILYGGDSMDSLNEEKINKWLKEHGCQNEIEKGHGMSELVGGCSYARAGYNKLGSMGIPFPQSIYSIVDPDIEDHLVPLKFEENMDRLKGEIVISSPHLTDGVFQGKEIFKRYQMDGNTYIRTKDLGEMDRDGIFYFNARKDRSFSRIDGYKVKPYEIENEIIKNEHVKSAVVVDYYDERVKGIMPICHILLENEEYDEKEQVKLVEEIVYKQIISNPTMCSRQIPAKFKIRDNMPLTVNNKVNFNLLRREKLDGSEINVDVHETNIAIDRIDIYKQEQNKEKSLKKN